MSDTDHPLLRLPCRFGKYEVLLFIDGGYATTASLAAEVVVSAKSAVANSPQDVHRQNFQESHTVTGASFQGADRIVFDGVDVTAVVGSLFSVNFVRHLLGKLSGQP